MKNICSNCEFWQREESFTKYEPDGEGAEHIDPSFGTCQKSILWKYYEFLQEIEDCFQKSNTQNSFGGELVKTHQSFGCIHFNPSPTKKNSQ